MKTKILGLMTTALFIGLLSSCLEADESSEIIFQQDLKKIEDFVSTTDIVAVKEVTVEGTGIVLLFTEENPDGEIPVVGDSLRVDYTGYFLDGTVFDTSVEQVALDHDLHNPSRDYEPFSIRFGYGVINGWNFALSHMKEGEKATALIPSAYAYGPLGNGPIGPNTVLAFDLELVEIKK